MTDPIPPVPDKVPEAPNKKIPTEEPVEKTGVTRTFFTDVVNVKGSYDEGYLSSKLYEERKRNLEEEERRLSRRGNMWWATLSIILILTGSLAIVVVFQALRPTIGVSDSLAPFSHIQVDTVKDTPISVLKNGNFTDAVVNPADTEAGTVSQIIITNDLGQRLTFSELAANMEWEIPLLLSQSVGQSFTFGVNHKTDNHGRFLILSSNSQANVADGMQRWEEEIADALTDILKVDTFTTLPADDFSNSIVSNKNIRVLMGQTLPESLFEETEKEEEVEEGFSLDELIDIDALLGDFGELADTGFIEDESEQLEDPSTESIPLLLYGFANEQTLIIAADQETFTTLIKRLKN